MTASEIQAAESAMSRAERERRHDLRRRWGVRLSAILSAAEWVNDDPANRGEYALEMSGDDRPAPVPPPSPALTDRLRDLLPKLDADAAALVTEAIEWIEDEPWT